MSVINKMLQDLQKRDASASAQARPRAVATARPKRFTFGRLMLAALPVLCLLWWFWPLPKPPASTDAAVATLIPAELATAAKSAMLTTAEGSVEFDRPRTEQATEQTTEQTIEQTIERTEAERGAVNSPVISGDVLNSDVVSTSAEKSEVLNSEVVSSAVSSQTAITAGQTPVAAKKSDPLVPAQHEVVNVAQIPATAARSTIVAPASSLPVINDGSDAAVTAPQALAIEQTGATPLAAAFELAVAAAERQQWQQALAYLTAEGPVAEFPAYYALKAALLQQQADWPAALALYQQLLQTDAAQPAWNLAAGIAAQQLLQPALAQRYFQVAWQGHRRLPAASQQFLQQQLSQMN